LDDDTVFSVAAAAIITHNMGIVIATVRETTIFDASHGVDGSQGRFVRIFGSVGALADK
jgi:putative heme iron utilization protein